MSGRPRIGVTGPDRGGAAAWQFTRLALWRAGARSVRLRPGRDQPDVAASIDGVVLGGGADVDPSRYGEPPVARDIPPLLRHRIAAALIWPLRWLFRRKRAASPDPARDAFETAVLETAVARGTPVLGICRGAQLIAVHFGGALQQDLRSFYVERPNPRSPLPAKSVRIESGTRLHEILGAERCTVNALHDQAIRATGPRLRIAAREDNGVVQAIEDAAGSFLLGVQWHPEYMPQSATQQALFRALADAARKSM